MSSTAMLHVFENSQTDGRARVLMLAIADEASEDGEFTPNLPRLSRKCNIPEAQVLRLLDYCSLIGEIRLEGEPPYTYYIAGIETPEPVSRGYRQSLLSRYGNRLAQRDGGWKCHYCGAELPKEYDPTRPAGERPTVDHVVPRAKGGTDNPDNLVLSCQSCNSRKNTQDYAEFIGGAS